MYVLFVHSQHLLHELSGNRPVAVLKLLGFLNLKFKYHFCTFRPRWNVGWWRMGVHAIIQFCDLGPSRIELSGTQQKDLACQPPSWKYSSLSLFASVIGPLIGREIPKSINCNESASMQCMPKQSVQSWRLSWTGAELELNQGHHGFQNHHGHWGHQAIRAIMATRATRVCLWAFRKYMVCMVENSIKWFKSWMSRAWRRADGRKCEDRTRILWEFAIHHNWERMYEDNLKMCKTRPECVTSASVGERVPPL